MEPFTGKIIQQCKVQIKRDELTSFNKCKSLQDERIVNPLLKMPSYYRGCTIEEICNEINSIIKAHESSIGPVHNAIYRSFVHGGVRKVYSKNVIDLADDILQYIARDSPKMNKESEQAIISELTMFMMSGEFIAVDGVLLLYSYYMMDSGLFNGKQASYMFTLKDPVEIDCEKVSIAIVICSSSEHILHFNVLKTSCVVRICIKSIADLSFKNDMNMFLSCIIDAEHNIDIYRKLLQ